ncbi:hypothetical protein SAMN02910369_03142, partial [Lachnospiraceae bacterium NE2001]
MKKMSKRKKIVFGSIGAGAVVIVAAVTAVFLFGATPQKRVLRAISYTYGNDIMDILRQYDENGGTMTIDADISGSDASNTLNIKVKDTVDKSACEMSGQAELGKNGSPVLDVDYSGDKDTTYLSVDGVTEGYLEFENDDFSDKFNQSALASIFGNIQGYNIDRFSNRNDKSAGASGASSGKKQGQGGFDIEALLKKADIKSEGKSTISIGDSKVKCNKYAITLSKKNVNSLLAEMSEQKQDGDGTGLKEGSRPSSALQLVQQLLNNQSQMGQMQGQNSYGSMMPDDDDYSSMMPGMFGGQQMPGQGQQMPGMFGGQQGGQQMPGQGQQGGQQMPGQGQQGG